MFEHGDVLDINRSDGQAVSGAVTLYSVIKSDDASALCALWKNAHVKDPNVFVMAMMNNSCKCLEYLMEVYDANGAPFPRIQEAVCVAILVNGFDCLFRLYINGFVFKEWMLNVAVAHRRHMLVDLFLRSGLRLKDWSTVVKTMIRNNDILGLTMLKEFQVPLTDIRYTDEALRHGFLDIFVYLHKVGCPWDRVVAAKAACVLNNVYLLHCALGPFCVMDSKDAFALAELCIQKDHDVCLQLLLPSIMESRFSADLAEQCRRHQGHKCLTVLKRNQWNDRE